MRIFFSAGEASGELHAANLIQSLRTRTPLEAAGLGGPRMREVGCELVRDMSDLAIIGIIPALVRVPQFFRLLAQVERKWDEWQPDAVVLIDYPGFNWHVARKAKERGIPVYYYGLPQMWGWAPWRVKKVQKYVDQLAQAVREACQRATGTQIGLPDLPDWVHLAGSARQPEPKSKIKLDEFLAEIEKELLGRALRIARGNKSKAAQLLGLSRPRLLRRLAQLGILEPAAADEPVHFEQLPDEP